MNSTQRHHHHDRLDANGKRALGEPSIPDACDRAMEPSLDVVHCDETAARAHWHNRKRETRAKEALQGLVLETVLSFIEEKDWLQVVTSLAKSWQSLRQGLFCNELCSFWKPQTFVADSMQHLFLLKEAMFRNVLQASQRKLVLLKKKNWTSNNIRLSHRAVSVIAEFGHVSLVDLSTNTLTIRNLCIRSQIKCLELHRCTIKEDGETKWPEITKVRRLVFNGTKSALLSMFNGCRSNMLPTELELGRKAKQAHIDLVELLQKKLHVLKSRECIENNLVYTHELAISEFQRDYTNANKLTIGTLNIEDLKNRAVHRSVTELTLHHAILKNDNNNVALYVGNLKKLFDALGTVFPNCNKLTLPEGLIGNGTTWHEACSFDRVRQITVMISEGAQKSFLTFWQHKLMSCFPKACVKFDCVKKKSWDPWTEFWEYSYPTMNYFYEQVEEMCLIITRLESNYCCFRKVADRIPGLKNGLFELCVTEDEYFKNANSYLKKMNQLNADMIDFTVMKLFAGDLLKIRKRQLEEYLSYNGKEDETSKGMRELLEELKEFNEEEFFIVDNFDHSKINSLFHKMSQKIEEMEWNLSQHSQKHASKMLNLNEWYSPQIIELYDDGLYEFVDKIEIEMDDDEGTDDDEIMDESCDEEFLEDFDENCPYLYMEDEY